MAKRGPKFGNVPWNKGATENPVKRFWRLVQKSKNGCWLWLGGPHSERYGHRYGNFKLRDPKPRTITAHRYSWMLHFGKIPLGKQVCHSCDNMRCVRPDHLWLGTHKQNHADCTGKGRRPQLKGERNGWAKATEKDVRLIRKLITPEHGAIVRLARRLKLPYMRVYKIVKRLRWGHVT